MLLALPTYRPADALRAKMRPLVTADELESFEGSHFVEEYWLKWKNGQLQKPGSVPYGLHRHEGELMAFSIHYAFRKWAEAQMTITSNIREFENQDIKAAYIGLPDDIGKLLRHVGVSISDASGVSYTTVLFGIRVVDVGHFKHGVLFDAPLFCTFGRYLAFPERAKPAEAI